MSSTVFTSPSFCSGIKQSITVNLVNDQISTNHHGERLRGEILWDLLTSNFTLVSSNPENNHVTDFYPRWEPNQGQELNSTVSYVKSDIPTYLYKSFYGIKDGQFLPYPEQRLLDRWSTPEGDFDYSLVLGRVSYDEFLIVEREVPYMPSVEEAEEARSTLSQKGLPVELIDLVLEFAEYRETRALMVPHDPFHKQNREQLEHFLGECWKVMMRCDMMAKALGGGGGRDSLGLPD
ncbi:hypothetical protein PG994_002402 [Apiospora phragmitis]|uniref:Uncharacterized protein n=1 Tax=Apiospora phragmitis TaxID=2905665 RepID=A0ABR1WW95_9PEZI